MLYSLFHINIFFAYRSFQWDSESKNKAQVYVVIICINNKNKKDNITFDGKERIRVDNINPYIIDYENIIIESKNNPICNVPKMTYGSKPVDGGGLYISQEEIDSIPEN